MEGGEEEVLDAGEVPVAGLYFYRLMVGLRNERCWCLHMDFSRSGIGALDTLSWQDAPYRSLSIVTASDDFMVSMITSQPPNSAKGY